MEGDGKDSYGHLPSNLYIDNFGNMKGRFFFYMFVKNYLSK